MDTTQLDDALQGLQPPRLNEAIAKALSDTQRAGKTRAAMLIARSMGVRSATVKDRIVTPFVTPGANRAEIRASKRPIALNTSDFPSTRQTGAGVVTRAWGRPVTIRGAFIASMRSGYTGAFVRVSRSRLPLKKLWGPTIWGTFVARHIAPPVTQRLVQQLPGNLVRRIRSEMRRRG